MSQPTPNPEFALRFQVSDRTLFKVVLAVHSFSVPPGAGVEPSELRSPEGLVPYGAEGYVLRAHPLPPDAPRFRRDGSWLCYVVQTYQRCYIDLFQSFEEYKKKFSPKTRSTIARKIKKWAEHTGMAIKWQCFRTSSELAEFYPLARSVSVRTYQEKLLDAGLPEGQDFVAQMHHDADAGNARGYILFHGDSPVSYLYCPIVDGVVIYAYLGYDPAYLKHSVGTILQWLALEELFSEGRFKFFDFTEGETDHKRLFATHVVPSANVLFIRHTWPREFMLRSHFAFTRLVETLRDLVDRWGLLAKLRRWQRFGSDAKGA